MALSYLLHVCSARISADGREVQLFPAGDFVAVDGRPGKGKRWRMNAQNAERIIRQLADRKNRMVIDYEHQTLYAEKNGQPAPAAGWFKQLEWREGDGLYAVDVEWTERAKDMIRAGEYRYISPVFGADKQGNVIAIHSAGLTNDPGLDGMRAVAARQFQSEATVNEKLRKLLGLDEDADEAALSKAVEALKSERDTHAETVESLKADVEALKAQVEKGGTGADKDGADPDPAKFVPVGTVKELQDEIQALRKRVNGGEVDQLVSEAMEDGRLLPAMEDWARKLGESNIEALKHYIESAQPIAALGGTQTGGKNRDGDAKSLSDEDRIVCRQLGISEAEFLKQKAGDQPAEGGAD